jgi:hypothetical protein
MTSSSYCVDVFGLVPPGIALVIARTTRFWMRRAAPPTGAMPPVATLAVRAAFATWVLVRLR